MDTVRDCTSSNHFFLLSCVDTTQWWWWWWKSGLVQEEGLGGKGSGEGALKVWKDHLDALYGEKMKNTLVTPNPLK